MEHIWLIGMMGTGKTAVGMEVANRLDVSFVDADDEVVSTTGRSIASLFAEGESVFRAVEHDVIAAIASSHGRVVATGGGVVLDQDNVKAMRASGTTILLVTDAETIRDRLANSDERPLLNAEGDIERIATNRAGVYRESADVTIETTGMSIEQVVDRVVACAHT
jgi:shikimate kinase